MKSIFENMNLLLRRYIKCNKLKLKLVCYFHSGPAGVYNCCLQGQLCGLWRLSTCHLVLVNRRTVLSHMVSGPCASAVLYTKPRTTL